MTRSLSGGKSVVRRKDCAIVDLEVGEIPVPAGSALAVALILLRTFPRILNIKCVSEEWKAVAKTIKDFKRIGAFVDRSGKVQPPHLMVFSDVSEADAINVGRSPEDCQV